MPSTLAQRLKKFRAARKMTQAVLAERAGIHPTYLAKIETDRQVPTLTVLAKLARALEVSVGRLVQ